MQKKKIATLEKCYAIAPLNYQGKFHFLVAAEKKERCILFDAEGNEVDTIWDGPGGVMSMAQVPGSDGQFLATHKFYSPNDSAEAKIVIATPGKKKWKVQTLVELPFVHRFDILQSNGTNYLIACTLKSGHQYKNDWSVPGKVYAAVLPENLEQYGEGHQLELKVIKEGLLKNHGYCKVTEDGKESALVCCEQGIFRFYPPEKTGEEWHSEMLLDVPTGDAALVDLDGDGQMELVTLEPFHGNHICIYKKIETEYLLVYKYPKETEFLHALWSGELLHKQMVVIGYREQERNLLALYWNDISKKYEELLIDGNVGPANVYGYEQNGIECLIAANREINEVAMYIFDDGGKS